MIRRRILTLLLIFPAMLGGVKAYVDYRLQTELNKTVNTAKIPMTYSDTYFTPLGAIRINNLHFSSYHLAIEAVTLHQAYRFYDLHTLPTFMHLTVQKIQIPIYDGSTTPPPLWDVLGYGSYHFNLKSLGYTSLNAELDIIAKKISDNVLEINGFFNIDQCGKLTLQAKLENVPPPSKWTNTTIMEVPFTKLSMSYTDDEFFKRLFSFLAQRNKVTVKQLKQTLKAKIVTDLKQSGLTIDNSILTSLQHFIQDSKTLTIHLQPSTPLTIHELEKLLLTATLKPLNLTMDTQLVAE